MGGDLPRSARADRGHAGRASARTCCYPPELLTIQTNLLGRYHVDDAETLFNGTERWAPAAAAAPTVGAPSPGAASPVAMFMPPGGLTDDDNWSSVLPYSPGAGSGSSSARDQLAAMAVADHDDSEQLDLIALTTEPGRDLSTPLVAQSAIDADPAIAQVITLLNANGSLVEFGPMTPLVLDDGARVGPLDPRHGHQRDHRAAPLRRRRGVERARRLGQRRRVRDRRRNRAVKRRLASNTVQ